MIEIRKKLIRPSVNNILEEKIGSLREQLKEAEKEFSKEALGRMGLDVGDIIENDRTGLRYKITMASASPGSLDRICHIFIQARRIYTTGRRAGTEARTTSIISWISEYSKIEEVKSND